MFPPLSKRSTSSMGCHRCPLSSLALVALSGWSRRALRRTLPSPTPSLPVSKSRFLAFLTAFPLHCSDPLNTNTKKWIKSSKCGEYPLPPATRRPAKNPRTKRLP
ncbi:hypothetical protein EJ06DRAFT_174248 [Trichodelitschia bisporula]|uniref:Uncharacterized protein n=1 Tax=Trichodelitschia bisporula TaxID=703511 RepID=A0A6G1HLG9_9PEZI|nr:hypothetical protein EJ06DRAFT_174248 [Trichodelitschia bisporula]